MRQREKIADYKQFGFEYSRHYVPIGRTNGHTVEADENDTRERERENNDESINKVMFKQKIYRCDYCGGERQRTNRFNRYKCPAFGKICQKCGLRNHFTNVCLNNDSRMNNKHGDSRPNRTTYKRRNVRAIEEIERHENDSYTESDDNIEECYMQIKRT